MRRCSEQDIVSMYLSGVKIREIMERCGYNSFNGIYSILRRHGVGPARRASQRKRPLDPEEVEWILEMHREGVPVTEIARMLGRPRSTIYGVLRRVGR